MPVNNFTVGRDISLSINTGNGGQLTIPGITDFQADPITSTLQSKPLGSPPIHGFVPNGWNISLKLDRQNSIADDYWANFEAAYYAGGNQVGGTILETINEPDGSVTQWRYTGVVLKLDKAGDFSGDAKVMQSLSGFASQRVKVT